MTEPMVFVLDALGGRLPGAVLIEPYHSLG